MDDKRFDWSPTLTTKLIDLYQENRCLWDQTDDKYKDRAKRESALLDISNYFSLTPEEIKRKIHNLRNQFNQEYNKSVRLYSNGTEAEEVRSRWGYYDQLKFIRSNCKPTTTQTIYVNTSKTRQSIELSYVDTSEDETNIKHEPKKRYIEIEEYVPEKIIKTQNISNSNNSETVNAASKNDDTMSMDPLEYETFSNNKVLEKYVVHQKATPQPRQSSVTQHQHQSMAKKRAYEEQTGSQQLYDTKHSTVILESPSSNCNLNSREDEYSVFGQFVGNELRSLKNPANCKKLKRLIQKAILDVTTTDDDDD